VLFLASGAAGLIYQVVWTQDLVLIFGDTTLAIVTTVTAFLAGLGIGSLVGAAVGARLRRALAVYGLNAALGLAASAASGAAAAVTFGWLVPMTAVCALALAAATVTRSANVGVAAGSAGWAIAVLAGRAVGGRFTIVVTDSSLFLPYLAFAACCGAVVLFATRIPRGTR